MTHTDNGHGSSSVESGDMAKEAVPVGAKIIDLLNDHQGSGPFTSVEFFPPRTKDGVKNLRERMGRMLVNCQPLFSDITWGAGGSTADLTLELAMHLHITGHVSNMHLTCTNMSRDMLVDALQKAYEGGIRNIVALRGDPPHGQDEWSSTENGFTCALDLVRYVREKFSDDFGISVAGYPEGHPSAISEVSEKDVDSLTDSEKSRASVRGGVTLVCRDDKYEEELAYLKAKVDAGGDFIITQMFFDVTVFQEFVKDCRRVGISCPIVPGLMCINAYPGFVKMTDFCKTRVPSWLAEKMACIKDDAAAVKAFGVEFGIDMCRQLIEIGVPGLHFYTLNLERCVYEITDELGWSSVNANGKCLDTDAKSMVAVGSAWARVGDSIKSIFGNGIVSDIRKEDGVTEVIMDSWQLAGGQRPKAYLQQGAYHKTF